MIQELIEAKVNAMDANSMTYNFLHADVEWQNLEADNETLPAVFMDMPVQFTPIVKVGGAYERKYSINCLFLFKSNLDDNADQRYSSLKLAENAQRQFHLMIDNDNANFKGVEVGQCFQVMNFLDCNLDGIVMPFTFTERNSDSVCIPSSDPVCRPVTYLIKDEDDNILYSGSVASGGTLIKAIQSGQVKNSLGTVLGTVLAEGELTLSDVDNIDSDGSTVPTPAGVAFTCTPVSPCDDATAVLKDTDGTTISTTNIASSDTVDIEAPNGSYTVEYVNGTLIESGSVLSGGSVTVEVPNPIVCDDATVTLNSVTMDTIPSGTTENIQVLQSDDMTEVGSKQGIHWRVADSDISLNGGAFLSVKAEDSQDIELVDQDDNDIIPISVIGNVIKVDIPSVSGSDYTALLKTGDTFSGVVGCDGDLQIGDSRTVLPFNNVFGNTDRFTDTEGLQLWAVNNIVLDHRVRISDSILGYYKDFGTLAGGSFNTIIPAIASSFTEGGFSGWHCANENEVLNIKSRNLTGWFNYFPFFNTSTFVHTSSVDPSNTSLGLYFNKDAYEIRSFDRATDAGIKPIPCRYFTLAELGL